MTRRGRPRSPTPPRSSGPGTLGMRRAAPHPGHACAIARCMSNHGRATQIHELRLKVRQVRVQSINQRELPFTPPALENTFTRTCLEDRRELLEIDHAVDGVSLREARNDPGLVFRHTPAKAVRHADVERTA